MLYETIFSLEDTGDEHLRTAYNFVDFLDNIAGMYDLVKGFLGYIMFSISYHSFKLSAIKKMFLVKAENSYIFEHKKSQTHKNLKGISKYLSPKITDMIDDSDLKK